MSSLPARLLAALALLVAATAACGPLHENGPGCIIGPCTPQVVGLFPMPMIIIPSSRISGGNVHLTVGDTLRLTVVHVMGSGPACQPIDTVRDSVRWGVTDSVVASIDAQGLLRARSPGTLSVLMLVGGTTPITPALPPQFLLACPALGLYDRVVVDSSGTS